MPLYNREDWLQGLKEIKSIDAALKKQQKYKQLGICILYYIIILSLT